MAHVSPAKDTETKDLKYPSTLTFCGIKHMVVGGGTSREKQFSDS